MFYFFIFIFIVDFLLLWLLSASGSAPQNREAGLCAGNVCIWKQVAFLHCYFIFEEVRLGFKSEESMAAGFWSWL